MGYPQSALYGGYSIGILDSTGIVERTFLNRKYNRVNHADFMISNTSFYLINDKLVFWEYINDTVYCVNSSLGIDPRFVFDYGQNFVTRDAFTDRSILNSQISSGKLILTRIIESKSYLFLSGIKDAKRKQMIFNKKTSSLWNLLFENNTSSGLVNDLDNGVN